MDGDTDAETRAGETLGDAVTVGMVEVTTATRATEPVMSTTVVPGRSESVTVATEYSRCPAWHAENEMFPSAGVATP